MRPRWITTAQLNKQVVDLDGRADHVDRRERLARLDDPRQLDAAAFEQGALMEKVLAGVGGNSELGEQDHQRLALRRLRDHLNGLKAVEGRIGDLKRGKSNRNPDEIVIV